MTRVWAVFLQEIFSYTRRSFDSKPAFRVRWETSLGRISLGISIPLYKGQDVYCALHTREMWTGSNISPFIQAHIILLITHNCIHINGSFKTSIHQTQHLELHICLKMSYPKHLKTVNYQPEAFGLVYFSGPLQNTCFSLWSRTRKTKQSWNLYPYYWILIFDSQ